MKRYETIFVNMLWNENTNTYEYDLYVRIVNMEDICFSIDKYIGEVEYDDGWYLEVWYSSVYGLMGFWLDENGQPVE